MRLSAQVEIDKAMDIDTPKTKVIVGRSPKNDLVIPHDSISREHCRIEIKKGIFYITDLGSSNGTFIDGQKLIPNQATPCLETSALTLGRIECALSEGHSQVEPGEVISSNLSTRGDYTATMRISRIDLNRPSLTLANEKKLKAKGPKNPISQAREPFVEEKKSFSKIFLFLFLCLALVAAWYLAPND